jgi:hypothetical protein
MRAFDFLADSTTNGMSGFEFRVVDLAKGPATRGSLAGSTTSNLEFLILTNHQDNASTAHRSPVFHAAQRDIQAQGFSRAAGELTQGGR